MQMFDSGGMRKDASWFIIFTSIHVHPLLVTHLQGGYTSQKPI